MSGGLMLACCHKLRRHLESKHLWKKLGLRHKRARYETETATLFFGLHESTQCGDRGELKSEPSWYKWGGFQTDTNVWWFKNPIHKRKQISLTFVMCCYFWALIRYSGSTVVENLIWLTAGLWCSEHVSVQRAFWWNTRAHVWRLFLSFT